MNISWNVTSVKTGYESSSAWGISNMIVFYVCYVTFSVNNDVILGVHGYYNTWKKKKKKKEKKKKTKMTKIRRKKQELEDRRTRTKILDDEEEQEQRTST